MRRAMFVIFLLLMVGAIYGAWKKAKNLSESSSAPVTMRVTAQPGLISGSNENAILAINAQGDVWGWGDNRVMQLGVPDRQQAPLPVRITSGMQWSYVHAGSNASYVISPFGRLWRRPYSQSVDSYQGFYGDEREKLFAKSQVQYVSFMPDVTWTKAQEGWGTAAGLDTDSRLWVWQEQRVDRRLLAGGKELEIPLPTAHLVKPLQPWADFCVGQNRLIAVAKDGTLWKFNGNLQQALDAGRPRNNEPGKAVDITLVQMPAKARFNRVRCWTYANQVYLLTPNGELWGYGTNSHGELGNGDGDRYTATSPVPESAIVRLNRHHWAEVMPAPGWGVGIHADGSLWTWGLGGSGALGTGDREGNDRPVQIDKQYLWVALAVTHDSAAALTKDGEIYTWGSGANGKLADGGGSPAILRPTKIFDNQRWGTGLE